LPENRILAAFGKNSLMLADASIVWMVLRTNRSSSITRMLAALDAEPIEPAGDPDPGEQVE
jgi:hypothetical protein